MDDTDETLPTMNSDIETDVKELMGLFDLPAFARRGQDLEATLRRLHDRCRDSPPAVARDGAPQAAAVVAALRVGPESWRGVFTSTIESLWELAEAEPPRWASSDAPLKRRQSVAQRPDRGRRAFQSPLASVRRSIQPRADQLRDRSIQSLLLLEKECVMGSARLAARHFHPVPRLTKPMLLAEHPTLARPRARRLVRGRAVPG